jgi:uncharacterized protein (DUF2141 family)
MRLVRVFLIILLCCGFAARTASQGPPAPTYTLTIVVEGMSSNEGNLGVLVFNNAKGWPEDRTVALRDIAVPAQKGTQTLKVPDLPTGKYAVALIHDLNKNHKLDKNFVGYPKEQWGMSNNPHATIKSPPIEKAMFDLSQDLEIHIKLQ